MTIPAQTFVSGCVTMVLLHLFLVGVAYLIMLERKIASWAQDRVGPNRVGFTFGLVGDNAKKRHFGLGQPLADGLKFLIKEDYNPTNVDKWLFLLAPAMAAVPALIGWAVIPFGGRIDFPGFDWGWLTVEAGQPVVAVADIHIGVIYILAVSSLAVYGVVVGAWASNNKYAFFGGLRGTAQMLSYEIPMGLTLLCVLLMAGSARGLEINNGQIGWAWGVIPLNWYILHQPLAAVLFFTCILAETNRAPFDLAEAESELVGGYHTEYSSMKFALFFLGEYLHMVTGAAFFALIFLGGWHLPGMDAGAGGLLDAVGRTGVYLGKIVLLLAVMMWIRWTLPRFRFDQLMRLAWRTMIPMSLALLLLTGILVFLNAEQWLLVGNIAVFVASLLIAPLIPAGPPVNRRVGLEGSRFSPATD